MAAFFKMIPTYHFSRVPETRQNYSPTELLEDSQLVYHDMVEHFKQVMDKSMDMNKYFTVMVAFSRLWYNADRTIVNYAGEDFVQSSLEVPNNPNTEFCKSLYASLTNRGKAILKFIFAEAQKIHLTFNQPDVEVLQNV